MRKITQLLSALVFCSLIIFASCGPKDNPDPVVDVRIEKGNNLKTVVVSFPTTAQFGGVDRTEWSGLKLAFTFDPTNPGGGTYKVTGVPTNPGADDVWGAEGATVNWTFDTNGENVTFGGKTAKATISATSVKLEFKVTASGARTSEFAGDWAFTWTK
jgi:hypothetical protein